MPTSTKLIFKLGSVSDCAICDDSGRTLPESTLRANTQILQNEPYADLVVGVGQTECTGAEATDQIPSEHPTGASRDGLCGRRHGRWALSTWVVLWWVVDGLAVLIGVGH